MDDLSKSLLLHHSYQDIDKSDKQRIEGQKPQEFSTLCYNVNNLKMIAAPNAQGTNTVNLAQLSEDNKTIQYITQPFATSYGQSYALVNPIQLSQNNGVANITVDGRQIVVNKPISTNTISNISFKCDVCGMMFAHLTLLNQHKRSHSQEETQNETVTIVTQQPNILQAQNLISESGQNLGQIQVVSTESLEPAHQTQTIQHTANDMPLIQQHHKAEKHKCITCNGPISHNPKRKGPKLIRCETCIQNDTTVSNQRPTQIYVSPEGDIKFEIQEIEQSSNVIQHSNMPVIHKGGGSGKKKNQNVTTTVSKCTTCNGTGVVLVSDNNMNASGMSQKAMQRTMNQQQKGLTNQVQQLHFQTNSTPEPMQFQSPLPPQNPQHTVEKPFHCNVCGGKFSRYSSLWSHKKLHSGEKNYKCETCGIAFAKAVYLKNHMRIHTGEKPYRCNTCGMQFSQSPHLKNHERTHSGEKPYVCEVCDKGFARHATLWNHRRIHTGEKPYKCNRCQSAFSQAAHLKNHEKVHLGLKPFKCDICSGAFADRFALKRHRNIHEKYGQTAPIQSNTSNNIEGEEQHHAAVAKQEVEDEESKIIITMQ